MLNRAGTIVRWGCTSVSASGTARSGDDQNVLDITSSSWNNCTAPGGTIPPTQVGTWTFHGDGPATASTNDLIVGHIDNVRMHHESPVGICSFDIAGNPTGTVPGRIAANFDEATQKLTFKDSGFSGNLYTYNVAGCLGQVLNGQPADIVGFTPSKTAPPVPATFTLTVPDGPINLISSP